MAGLFKLRKPKRIVPSSTGPSTSQADEEEEDSGPVVRRPGALKQKSKLRVAFDHADADTDHDANNGGLSENDSTVAKPATSIRPNAALRDRLRETRLRDDPDNRGHDSIKDDTHDPDHDPDRSRPSYSKSYLDELRNSTPSTPRDLITTTPPSEQQLEVASKFPNASRSEVSNKIQVLTASEIAAAKARRARLAQEKKAEDFIPLDDHELYDSDGEFKPQRLQLGSYNYSAAAMAHGGKGTRLEHEDEDIMEGFDAFVEDGPASTRIQMDVSKRAERQRRKAQKEAMRAQIDAAEDTDSDGSGVTGYSYDSDDGERHRAYEEAQFHAGLDGLRQVHEEHSRRSRRPKQPKITTPIEKLAVGLERLREQVQRMELEKQRLEKRQIEIGREKDELHEQREHVQKALEESSKELDRVQGGIQHTLTHILTQLSISLFEALASLPSLYAYPSIPLRLPRPSPASKRAIPTSQYVRWQCLSLGHCCTPGGPSSMSTPPHCPRNLRGPRGHVMLLVYLGLDLDA
ncbi:hypothetical protein DV735_g3090, partial [Chaetothyriales sp. CBS 134920]